MAMAFDQESRRFKAINGTNLPLLSFVMSGGSGSRLWPLSRLDKPKQFHRLSGAVSLLAGTLNRLNSIQALTSRICVIGVQSHFEQIKDAISEHNAHAGIYAGAAYENNVRMILEPVARNTAAVAALAAASALIEYDDALVLLCPADHEISTTEQFWQTVAQGMPAASQGAIVTFGLLPERPETGYGYIETGQLSGHGYEIARFVEKPDHDAALAFIRQSNFFWNSGIFLCRASVLRDAFLEHALEIWRTAYSALQNSKRDDSVTSLPEAFYCVVPSESFDRAIMEKAASRVLIPAAFCWSDLGSWQALLQLQQDKAGQDMHGNVVAGDVVAHDCHNSYLRSESSLLAISGVKDMAVIATKDATFIAPLTQSHHVQAIVAQLTRQNRRELYYDKPPVLYAGNRERVHDWLFEKALPHWAEKGVDRHYGGFHEKLSLQGLPVADLRRTRTMARQIYAFAKSQAAGWNGEAASLIAHGLIFMQAKGRSRSGGWVQSFHADGRVAESQENFYDQTCMLLALAYAYKAGHNHALQLAQETFAFLDTVLRHAEGGFFETTSDRNNPQAVLTSNAHMHYLEACLAWHEVSGDSVYLNRAAEVIDLCSRHFFDDEHWCLGEFFTANWHRPSDERGDHTEPGHAYEWAALLCDYANRTGHNAARRMANRLYACALSSGANRATGLAYNVVSREGRPLDTASRSWQQCEGIKAAIMLDGYNGHDLKPEIEARIANLFYRHLDPAGKGLWMDRVDAGGLACSDHVPASILYHLVGALTLYLQFTRESLRKTEPCPPARAERMALHA